MRKFGVFLLSVILFVSLLGFALSVSSNLAFTNPAKVKGWLNQSNLYGNVIADATKAQQASGNGTITIPLSDPGIQKIAQSTFSSKLLQKNVGTVVDSNYTWLEGKKSAPNFTVDLAPAKETFAQKVGEYVQARLSSLPVCTTAQLSEIDTSSNPLALSCRPASMDPAAIASKVTDSITNSTAFLSNPVITASNLNPKGDNEEQPYYQNLSGLPAVYQFGTKLPLIAGLVAFASIIGIIFIPRNHKRGVRVVGVVLLMAGLVLVITKLVLSQAFDVVHSNIFHASSNDRVQQAVIDFLQQAESYLANIEFWFGVAYLVAAIIILFTLRRMKRNATSTPSLASNSTAQTPPPKVKPASPGLQPNGTDNMRLKPPKPTPTMRPTPKRHPKKPPRLVQ